MSAWKPIKMVESQVEIDATPGCLNVTIKLGPRPDRHWEQLVYQRPNVDWPSTMRPMQISDGYLRMTPPDSELDRYIDKAQEIIDAANADYERTILPMLERKAEQKRLAEDERNARLEAAAERLKRIA